MAKKKENNQNVLGMLSHLLIFVAGFVVPLIFYLIYKEDKANKFVSENARHALNFCISLFIYWIAVFVLSFVVIGIFLMPVLGIFAFVVVILASVKSYKGEIYKYPLEIEFIK
ncbi:MAG TPA: DUF4870 domain-containing protein [Candidatus Woesearchaeota archaeon]|jgi:hypothetical protein|nr:DUF4870 domain-containing protein [Candidatus Woesearchaeota archaeon]